MNFITQAMLFLTLFTDLSFSAENRKEPMISFKPITQGDFEQLNAWLRIPHVAKWWYSDILPWDEFVAKYTENLNSDYIHVYFIQIDGKAVCYIFSNRR